MKNPYQKVPKFVYPLFKNRKIKAVLAIFSFLIFAFILIGASLEATYAQSGPGEVLDTLSRSVGSDNKNKEVQAEKNENQEGVDDNGKMTEAEAEKVTEEKPRSFKEWIKQFWEFPVLKTGDFWIQLNQLILALIVLIAGWIMIGLLSRMLGYLLKRLNLFDENTLIAITKTFFYFCFLIIAVLVVQIADLPLTFLTLLMAAIALGASLGAKSTINDYLSGLILAIEKPIRVGDCVWIENQWGFVNEIAGRFTIIRRFDGVDVLIPNSGLLENNLLNWTLRDNKIRGDIKVGVTHDSPAKRVTEIIQQAINEHKEVLDTPAASVQFWDFGESSLVFWAWFWTNVENPLDIWRIQSDIRFRIQELFCDNQIRIAYPQRDVHMDTREPVSVQMVRPEIGEPESKKKEEKDVPTRTGDREAYKETVNELKPDGEESESS